MEWRFVWRRAQHANECASQRPYQTPAGALLRRAAERATVPSFSSRPSCDSTPLSTPQGSRSAQSHEYPSSIRITTDLRLSQTQSSQTRSLALLLMCSRLCSAHSLGLVSVVLSGESHWWLFNNEQVLERCSTREQQTPL